MLLLTLKIGQTIDIPGVCRIELCAKSGRNVKLGFDGLGKDTQVKLGPLPPRTDRDDTAGR